VQKTSEPIEMSFGGLTLVVRRNLILDGGRDPPRKWAILGLYQHTEKVLRVSAAVYAAKGIVQSLITVTCTVGQYGNVQCSRLVGVTIHCPMKNPPPAMRLFVRIL